MGVQTERLRGALVDELRSCGLVRSAAIEAAMREVPRHVFVPEAPLDAAYANQLVELKWGDDGGTIISASEPGVIGMMLEQSDLRPGQRVLEIGGGTGYNAALLAHLVGPTGEVTTIEYDGDFAGRAERQLAAAGYERVRVIHGDGEVGYPDRAPYDRVIGTAGAWDLPPAWLDQLAPDGRLVVPLRLPSWRYSIAFDRSDGHLVSRSVETCGFVPMLGAGARETTTVELADGISLRFDDGQPADAAVLRQAFEDPGVRLWTDVMVGRGPFDVLFLWLACAVPRSGWLQAEADVTESGRIRPLAQVGSVCLLEADSLAYLTRRKSGPGFEVGVCAHGRQSAELARKLVARVRAWDPESVPRIEAFPAGSRMSDGYVVEKRHRRLAISFS